MKYYHFILLSGLLLTACSSVPIQYYRLPDAPLSEVVEGVQQVSADHRAVLIDVKLTDFLSGGGIAYQEDKVAVRMAQHYLWAERLNEGVKRVLLGRMQQYAPKYLWLGTAPDGRIPVLMFELSQFNGRDDGKAVLGGRWVLRDAKQKILMQSPFRIEVPQDGKGYEALVLALVDGLNDLSLQVSKGLRDNHINI